MAIIQSIIIYNKYVNIWILSHTFVPIIHSLGFVWSDEYMYAYCVEIEGIWNCPIWAIAWITKMHIY